MDITLKTFEFEFNPGIEFYNASREAKTFLEKNLTQFNLIYFKFNGIQCYIDSETDLDLLYRDFNFALLLDEKIIGPNCLSFVDNEKMIQIEKATKELNEIREVKKNEAEINYKNGEENFNKLIENIQFEFNNEERYKHEIDKIDKSPNPEYIKAILLYALDMGKLLQIEINNKTFNTDSIQKIDDILSYRGISGNMYKYVLIFLMTHWKHHEKLKKILKEIKKDKQEKNQYFELTLVEKIENKCKEYLQIYFEDRNMERLKDTIHLIQLKQVMPTEFQLHITLSRPGLFIGKAGSTYNDIKQFLINCLSLEFEITKFTIELKEFNPFK